MHDERLLTLVSECIARMEDEGERALDELCLREPDLSAALRARIERLRANGMLATAEAAAPKQMGDFRLERPLGSGGMGVVYQAEQISLGRRVALKLIRPEMLYFPGARDRFRREIDAVARLAHPGIVSILGCGEEQGLPYYAMEFVEGASLHDVLADLAGRTPASLNGRDMWISVLRRSTRHVAEPPLPPLFQGDWAAVCSRVIAAACTALDHAHAAGVLHRDLKPGNVLVSPAGRVVVVDFGLAALEGSDALTRTGSQLGSLPYMAPEQLRGDAAAPGSHTDVYALGVTLYELLTLRRPFESASAVELEREIRTSPPRRLRQLNPAVPRDLETVVQCALEPEPTRRYATPNELAADLARALGHRPIAARRTGPAGRLLRWARRRPAAALVLAGVPLLLLLAAGAWSITQRRGQQKQGAEELARTHLDVALLAIEVATAGGGSTPIERLLDLLDQAQRSYEALAATAVDPAVLFEQGSRLRRRRADLLEQLGRRADAEAAYRDAAAAARSIVAGGRDTPFWRNHLCDTLCSLGGVLQSQGRWQEALDTFEEAIASVEAGALQPGADAMLQQALASGEINRAQLLRLAGEHAEARAGFERSTALLEKVEAQLPGDAHVLDMLGMALAAHASLEQRDGNAGLALELWPRALARLEQSCRLEPDERAYADDLGTVMSHHGRALAMLGRHEEAEPVLARSLEVLTTLTERHPEVPDYRQRLLQALDSLAILRMGQERKEEALELFRRALAIAEELVAGHPGVESYVHDLPVVLNNVGQLELAMGLDAEALAHYARSSAIFLELGELAGPGGPMAERAVWSHIGHARAALRAGAHATSLAQLEHAALLNVDAPGAWREIAEAWVQLGRADPAARARDGRSSSECALSALRSALERGFSDREDLARGAAWETLRDTDGFRALLAALPRATPPPADAQR